MRKIFKYLTIVISIFFSNIAISSETIYYIDMDFIMNNSLAGKSIIKQLEEKNKANTDIFKKTETDLQKEETNIISQKSILDKKEFEEKVIKFNKKVSKYRDKRNVTINDYSKKRNIAQIELIKKLSPILGEYSKKNSISFILSKKNIIIGKTELDLTKIIIEILDKKIKTIKIK
jgi:Skp family chaperone for outer membrane proteins